MGVIIHKIFKRVCRYTNFNSCMHFFENFSGKLVMLMWAPPPSGHHGIVWNYPGRIQDFSKPKPKGRRQPVILPNFHENEENWTERLGCKYKILPCRFATDYVCKGRVVQQVCFYSEMDCKDLVLNGLNMSPRTYNSSTVKAQSNGR